MNRFVPNIGFICIHRWPFQCVLTVIDIKWEAQQSTQHLGGSDPNF